MSLPFQAIAEVTNAVRHCDSGIFFPCRYEIDGNPYGAVWMPDEETHWAEWIEVGTKLLVERLRPSKEFPGRINGTAMILCEQTTEVLTLVKSSRKEAQDHCQALSMPRVAKDPHLRNELYSIAGVTGLKAPQVVRQLCWEAICYRNAAASAAKLINESQ